MRLGQETHLIFRALTQLTVARVAGRCGALVTDCPQQGSVAVMKSKFIAEEFRTTAPNATRVGIDRPQA